MKTNLKTNLENDYPVVENSDFTGGISNMDMLSVFSGNHQQEDLDKNTLTIGDTVITEDEIKDILKLLPILKKKNSALFL